MNIESKPKKTLDSGQILIEIEENIWVDYETYKPISQEEKLQNDEIINE